MKKIKAFLKFLFCNHDWKYIYHTWSSSEEDVYLCSKCNSTKDVDTMGGKPTTTGYTIGKKVVSQFEK